MQNILLECARRDLSNGGVYGVAWVPWHGAQQIFARPSPASWAQRGQISALGLPGAPLIARRCSAIAPEHIATIGGHVGSAAGDLAWRPPSPCPWARPQPPTRHSQACRARLATRFALPSPQCPAAPSPSFMCAWAQPLLPPAAGGGAKASWVVQWPAGLQEDVRHRCISYSARLAPWKERLRCTCPRRTPPRHLRSSWPSPPLTRALVPSSRRSKICSLSSYKTTSLPRLVTPAKVPYMAAQLQGMFGTPWGFVSAKIKFLTVGSRRNGHPQI